MQDSITHEALEALIREITIRQQRDSLSPWQSHARNIVRESALRTDQLIHAVPSGDEVDAVARAINLVRFEDDGSSPGEDDYDMATAAITTLDAHRGKQ